MGKRDSDYSCFGEVQEIYDGDSMTVLFDLGFSIYMKHKVRIYAIDTPELRTRNKKEKKAGYMVRDWLREQLLDRRFKFRTYKKGKFGRILVDIEMETGKLLSETMIDKGYAVSYFGGTKVPFDQWWRLE